MIRVNIVMNLKKLLVVRWLNNYTFNPNTIVWFMSRIIIITSALATFSHGTVEQRNNFNNKIEIEKNKKTLKFFN